MEIIQGTTDFQLYMESAVAIGKFDGVHIGHRRLLEEIIEQKKNGLQACVFTFDPAPAVLFGLSDGKELTEKPMKREIFALMGVDVLIEFPLTLETAAIAPEVFVSEILADRLQARFIAAGADISFGAGGAGNMELLRELSGGLGFEVKLVEKVCVDGVEVSSSYIRRQVEQGNMELAERLLGAPYAVAGTVVHGNRVGRTLGFPTVNLLPKANKLLPPNGVYYSKVYYGGSKYPAISNVGCKPTVTAEGTVGVESYLYDFDREIYGQEIVVELLSFRRPEQRFADEEALKRQLQADIAAGERFHSRAASSVLVKN
ncbi:MAG: bifunctional riboflavin kinase/FAD synthetase [Butyrivibrio sp.]|nr:bifunctional riboflavin kinase/FAD synthetase [Muribaculum sp.]MCM1552121.1 bifunctional riboflavin kinase/FAD synthetase [Butyrivibrio sp.]